MNDTVITIAGNLVNEVRRSYTKGEGVPVASFRLASTSRRYSPAHQAWIDGETSYYSVNCWRQLADNVFDSLHKGDPVVVTGRVRVRDWEAGERRGTSVEVEATALGHDLSRGVSTFERKRRAQPAPGSEEELGHQLSVRGQAPEAFAEEFPLPDAAPDDGYAEVEAEEAIAV